MSAVEAINNLMRTIYTAEARATHTAEQRKLDDARRLIDAEEAELLRLHRAQLGGGAS